jgi:hypothetical protein
MTDWTHGKNLKQTLQHDQQYLPDLPTIGPVTAPLFETRIEDLERNFITLCTRIVRKAIARAVRAGDSNCCPFPAGRQSMCG